MRMNATDLPKPTAATLERLQRLAERADADIDTSDIPEHAGDLGRFGPIKAAILQEMGRRTLSGVDVWELARPHYPKLSKSMVYEYVKGKRALNADALEAILKGLGLAVVPAPDHIRKPLPKEYADEARRLGAMARSLMKSLSVEEAYEAGRQAGLRLREREKAGR